GGEADMEAMRRGDYGYVLKRLDPQPLRQLIRHAFEVSRLMQVPASVADAESAHTGEDLLIGKCPEMQEVYKAIGRVAPQNVTVLILGESGTGKELAARAIYNYSRRAKGPVPAINGDASPAPLLGRHRGARERA